jgi:hypothetical protein
MAYCIKVRVVSSRVIMMMMSLWLAPMHEACYGATSLRYFFLSWFGRDFCPLFFVMTGDTHLGKKILIDT